MTSGLNLSIGFLREAYDSDTATPAQIVRAIYAKIRSDDPSIWIHLIDEETVLSKIAGMPAECKSLPLYGIPFAIKDNIDAAGLATTAGCPEFAYVPDESAFAVQKLIKAGAILIGKTNLDQFATGLVGTRTPYGIPKNSFDEEYVPGGSSSGSAVAVAKGLVSFALGTDTAGSGRVPAAFNNIVGLKPTRGLISTSGVVPACKSLDCISIFSLTADDAQRVLNVAAGYDANDAYSRKAPGDLPAARSNAFKFGVPKKEQLTFFGNESGTSLFYRACKQLETMGGVAIEIDFSPFQQAATLLYQGAWVAERDAAVGQFLRSHPDDVDATVAEIINGGATLTARDAFEGIYKIKAIKQTTAPLWADVDFLLTPTAPCPYKVEDVLQNPIELNSNLGIYTNYVNLLDLSALAIPGGVQLDGMPFGVTLVGPKFHDEVLAFYGRQLHPLLSPTLGATGLPCPAAAATQETAKEDTVSVFVVGAHLDGWPLNHELTTRGGRLVGARKTAPIYRLFALNHLIPPRPGMVRRPNNGAAIVGEVWSLPTAAFGSFVTAVPGPLGFGEVELDDGEIVRGFLCEAYAIENAPDITEYGGWVSYTAAQKAQTQHNTPPSAQTGD